MEPEIETGEFIIIKEAEEYHVKDIITYDSEDSLITHRIIEKNGDEVITKGDANSDEDLKILENQIEGKVIYHSKIIRNFCNILFENCFSFICDFCNSNVLLV